MKVLPFILGSGSGGGGGGASTAVEVNGSLIGTQARLNLIEGSNITITAVNDGANNEVDVTISASGSVGAPGDAQYLALAADANLTAERVLTLAGGLSGSDGGAGGNYTVSLDIAGLATDATLGDAGDFIALSDTGEVGTPTQKVSVSQFISNADIQTVTAAAAAYAAISHTHAASEIDSGTLALARGGLNRDLSADSGLVKVSAGVTSIVTDNSSDWDTAFGWGNHALAGYLTDITGQTIQSLSNVTITGPSANDILQWNGTQWVDRTLGEAGIAAESHTHTLSQITDAGTIASQNANDVSITGGSISFTVITLQDGFGAAPTGDGIIKYDRTAEQLQVGTGLGTKVFSADADLSITESQISDLQSYLLNITGESIQDLSNVVITGPTSNDILQWSGTAWVDRDFTEANIAAADHNHTGVYEPADSDLTAIAGLAPSQGDIMVRGTTNWQLLTPGTSGQFLRSNGPGSLPSYEAIGGGGDLLSTNNLNDVADAQTALDNLLGADASQALRPGTTNNDTLLLQAYDTNTGPAYVTFATLTSGPSPTMDLSTAVTIGGNAILDSTDGLTALTDVSAATPTSGHALLGNGSTFASRAILTADISDFDADLTAIASYAASRGDILYYGASGWTGLAPGTSGHVLKSGGAGADPSWQAESGGGASALNDLSDVTITGPLTSGDFLIYNGANFVDLQISGDIAITGTGAATIANNAVTNDKILNSTISFSKLNNIADDTILGNVAGGFSNPAALNATQVRTLINVEDGATADQTAEEIMDLIQGHFVHASHSGMTAVYNDVNDRVEFTVSGGGGFTNLTIAGETGTPQTINDTETFTITGGTGITTSAGATRTVTVTTVDSEIVHDNLSGFDTNKHIDHSTVLVSVLATTNETSVTGSAQSIDGNVSFTVGIADNPTLPGTSGAILPSGTTAQRVDSAGRVRFNNQTNQFEGFNGTGWVRIDSNGALAQLDTVDTAQITAGAITNTEVDAAAAIALTKLADIAANTFLGRETSTGAITALGVADLPEVVTPVGATDFLLGWDNGVISKFDVADFLGGGSGDVTAGTQSANQVAYWNATAKQIEGSANFTWNGTTLSVNGDISLGADGTNQLLLNDANSSTAPDLSFTQDTNTGLYRLAADSLGLTTGGVRAIYWKEADLHVQRVDEMHTGIIASGTQTQGNGALLSSYNEVATVTAPNDVVTLPGAEVGKTCMIVNNGANTLQIFPASGHDLGQGTNNSTTLAAGKSITFYGSTTTKWAVQAEPVTGGTGTVTDSGGQTTNQLMLWTGATQAGDLADIDASFSLGYALGYLEMANTTTGDSWGWKFNNGTANEQFGIYVDYAASTTEIEKVRFQTGTLSATNNRGSFEFYVDDVLKFIINDTGITMQNNAGIFIGGLGKLQLGKATSPGLVTDEVMIHQNPTGWAHDLIQYNADSTNLHVLAIDSTVNGAQTEGQYIKWDDTANKLAWADVGSAPLANISGATYTTIQHMQDTFHSSGVISGGGITDDGDGTITVAAGTGTIRATNSDVAEILFFDWAAESGANVTLANSDQNYIYVEYNSGSPRVIATTVKRTDYNTNVFLGTVYRDAANGLYINDYTSQDVGDHARRMLDRMNATMPFDHASGGIVTDSGARTLEVSLGKWWAGLNEFETSAIDTGTGGTFTYWYNRSSWVANGTPQTAIDNEQYDSNGTLTSLGVNDFGVHWIYLDVNGGLHVIYGIQSNNTVTDAENEAPPTALPPALQDGQARLIGRAIVGDGDTELTSVDSTLNDTLTFAGGISDHNSLNGLQGGTTDDYQHLTSAQLTVVQNTSGTNTGDEPTATTSVEGVVQLATIAEVDTGTATNRAVTPDALAGSDHGTKILSMELYDPLTDVAADATPADDSMLGLFIVPASMDGYEIVTAHAEVAVAGTTGTTTVEVYKNGSTIFSASDNPDIGSGQLGSDTGTGSAPGTITASTLVATYDRLTFYCTATQTTAPKGLVVTLEFRKP